MKKKEFNKILGDLEAEIMEAVWELESASVREVLNKLKRRAKPAYTTVMTVMARLCNKGILRRRLNQDNAYIYAPVQDKENFLTSASKKIISSFINEFGEDIAVAQFIDVLENSNIRKSKELRRQLKRVIRKR